MDDWIDCLICGRSALPSGEPSCDCVTHSLSRPVNPPEHGPDPADVARFPLVTPAPTPPRPLRHRPAPTEETPVIPVRQRSTGGAHRKAQRIRFAAATGGAMAAVVGCTALAASLLGGGNQSREGQVAEVNPTLALPDGGLVPYAPEADADAGTGSPAPGETGGAETSAPDDRPDASGDPTQRPSGSASSSPEATTEEPSEPSDTTAPEPDPGDTGSTPPTETGDPSTSAPPSPTDNPTTPVVLRQGDYGREVVELQKRLRELNWVYMGDAHGRFNEETREAVATFQVAYGIRGDEEGVYGVNTRATLEAHTQEP